MYQKFKDSLVIIATATGYPSYTEIKKVYEMYSERFGFSMPNAYGKELMNQFEIAYIPHLVWVDKGGFVKAITSCTFLNESTIVKFIRGEALHLPEQYNRYKADSSQKAFVYNRPLLINGNGGPDTGFIYRSVLSKWTPGSQNLIQESLTHIANNQVLVTCMSIARLYMMAYANSPEPYPSLEKNSYGKRWLQPVLKVNDPAPFETEFESGKNLYSYNLNLPPGKNDPAAVRKIMQNDLENYFGYKVIHVKQRMPYWSITLRRGFAEKLKTAGGKPLIDYGKRINYRLINQPVSKLVYVLWANNQHQPPFIDESGFKGNIDLTIDGIIADFPHVKQVLYEKGIRLKRKYKRMEVMIIKD